MKRKQIKCGVLLALLLIALCAQSGCYQANPDLTTGAPEMNNTKPTPAPTTPPATTPALPPFTPPAWEELYHILPWDQYLDAYDRDSELAKHPGRVYISEYLYGFLKHGTDAEQVYEIKLTELTGASAAEIYKDVILPLGVQETYERNQQIYVTQEQLASLKWPEEYAIVLWKGWNSEYCKITKEALANCTDKRLPVQIKLEFPVKPAPQDCKDEWARIAETYGVVISQDEEYPLYAYASVPPQTLIKMLDDEMIVEIQNQGQLFDYVGSDM